MPDRRVPRDYERTAKLFGEKVRALRADRGLTQDELAGLTGMHRNQIQNIENSRNNTRDPQTGRPGPGNPRMDTIFLLAEMLSVEVTYLIDVTRAVNPLPERT